MAESLLDPRLALLEDLEHLVHECYYRMGNMVTARFLDHLKEIGFTYATMAGITVGIDDLMIPEEKASIIAFTSGPSG